MTLAPNHVIRTVKPWGVLDGVYRILWLNRAQDRAWLIHIPASIDGQSVRYYPSSFAMRLSLIESALQQNQIATVHFSLSPIMLLGDEEIKARYPRRNFHHKKKQRDGCAALRIRDEKWDWIEPLASEINASRADVFETGRLSEFIKTRSKTLNVEKNRIYDAVNRYLVFGCGKNGLLPALTKCGHKGKKRSQKTKLGNKNAAFKAGLLPHKGLALDDDAISKIQFGWAAYVSEGRSVKEGYLLTMGAFWSSEVRIENGVYVPTLKDPLDRPTEAQFRYWGPKGEDGKSACEQLLRPDKWEKTRRALCGTARDGIKAIGQIGSIDGTSNDVNLVRVDSILKAIGTANRFIVHEGLSDLIVGFDCGLNAPSEQTIRMAIYNAASDKQEFGKRFGVDITPYEMPAVFFAKYRADNGEAKTAGLINDLPDLQSGFEYVPRGRADLNAAVETLHRIVHKLVDHKIAGTTMGRQRERGEEPSAIHACWTYYQYMKIILKAIKYYNTKSDATHLLTVEMRRDGVAPRRAEIFQWALRKGYVASPPHSIDQLRAKLLPTIEAVVRHNGIFLLRTDRGKKDEIVKGCRYIGDRAAELGWFEQARRSGAFKMMLRHDPNNLAKVWYVDEDGIHEFNNVANDPVLIREGTLADCLSMQDDDCVRSVANQGASDQALSDFVYERESINKDNISEKKDAIKNAGRKITKTELKSNIADNRAQELEALKEAAVSDRRTDEAEKAQAQEPAPSPVPDMPGEPDVIAEALKEFRHARNAQG